MKKFLLASLLFFSFAMLSAIQLNFSEVRNYCYSGLFSVASLAVDTVLEAPSLTTSVTPQQAKEYCQNLNLRLATVSEIKRIYSDYSKKKSYKCHNTYPILSLEGKMLYSRDKDCSVYVEGEPYGGAAYRIYCMKDKD